VKHYATHISSHCRIKNAFKLVSGSSIRFLMYDDPLPVGMHVIEEQTFLLLTARWNDEIIQWFSSLVHEENVVLLLRSILFSLRRLLWHPVWKSWRSAALPYGTYDTFHVESTQS